MWITLMNIHAVYGHGTKIFNVYLPMFELFNFLLVG